MKEMQNIKKRQELLRSFFYDIHVHDKNRLMEWLGIASSTYYKTLKELANLISQDAKPKRNQLADFVRETVKYEPYQQSTNLLAALYESKAIKKLASTRYTLILKFLQLFGKSSRNELIDYFNMYVLEEAMETVEFSDNEITRYLNDLEEAGFIKKTKEKGKSSRVENFYELQTFFENLSLEELLELYSFISFIINTEVPSAPGYPLRKKLLNYLEYIHDYPDFLLNDTFYQYPYFGKVLDEYIIFDLLEAIHNQRVVTIYYQSVKGNQKQVVNEKELMQVNFIPLHIVYDYLFARWYVVGAEFEQLSEQPLQRLRIDFITKMENSSTIQSEEWETWRAKALQELEKAWCITYREDTEKVRIKFTFYPVDQQENFIKKRVEEQGQWGKIIEEKDRSFIWEVDVNDAYELIPWIRSFGSSATVLEPQHLREKIATSWKEVAQLYEHHIPV